MMTFKVVLDIKSLNYEQNMTRKLTFSYHLMNST